MDPQVALRVVAVEPVTMVVICDSLDPGERYKTILAMRGIRPNLPIVLLAKEGAQERKASELQQTVVAERDEATLMEMIRKYTDIPEDEK